MAAAPLISVIIPCYNQSRFLADAIRSVRTTLAVEVVVVDDGSTDDTPRVARSEAGTIYHAQPNAGLAAARNTGLRVSRGERIVFLDADDMLAPGGLDVGSALLDAHPECACVTGRCLMMDADGRLLPTPRQPELAGDAYTELLRHNYIWTPAMTMFRRAPLVEAGGFNATVNAAADYELYLRIARRWRLHDHATVVAYYRQHGSNMSGDASRMLRETLLVHGAERRHADRDPARRAAFHEGRRRWQEFYGTNLVTEIRRHVRASEWGPAARKAATLGWHHPRGLVRHALRKFGRWIRGDPAGQDLP